MLKQSDMAAIREEYRMGELNEHEVAEDAIVQFSRWFEEALARQVMEPNAMTLSTVSAAGYPSARIVLLKDLDESGFGFFTNYQSRKGTELAGNPHAALLFFWPELQRQVRVNGQVTKMTAQQSDEYFKSRPRASQLGAIASQQSEQIVSRAVLDARFAELEARYKDTADIVRPAHWGGFRLMPDTVEFWQGGAGRLHDRLRYSRSGPGWQITRLAP